MFLLGWAKNIIERQITESLAEKERQPVPDFGKTYPGTAVEPEVLRRLIDDSFTYLSDAQRQEIFDALNRALLSPRNAAIRGTMIEHFASKALAVRAAQVRLSQLSPREKQWLAAEFRREIQGVPEAEIEQLRDVIEKRLLPMPADLNQLFLGVLDTHTVPAAQPVPGG